jgi:hypothetical protein
MEKFFQEILNKIKSNQKFFDRESEKKLMAPLLSLRQACCHPQVGSRGLKTLQKNTMTMSELLENLLSKATKECEDQQRSLCASMNALAGMKKKISKKLFQLEKTALSDLEGKKMESFGWYSKVLEQVLHSGVRVDKFTQCHLYHYLVGVMEELKIEFVRNLYS